MDLLYSVVKSVATSSVTWTAVGLFSAMLGLLYANQNKMLYVTHIPGYPVTTEQNPPPYRSPSDHGLKHENVLIPTSDGLRLHAWFIPSTLGPKLTPTLVFFHANAGNMGLRLPNVAALHKTINCNILIFDYRGYGISEGSPDEAGLMKDGEAVMKWVMEHPAVDPKRIVLFGRSLGGAVAIYMASKLGDQIAGVIVENTFFNVSRMVDKLFSWLGALKWLVLRIYWPSNERVQVITSPILIVSGTLDEIVPHEHSHDLYALATAAKSRELYVVEGGKHNDSWLIGGQPYLEKFKAFIFAVTGGVVDSATPSSTKPRSSSKYRNSAL